MTRKLNIKVCGMRNADNITDVSALRPDYIGFIFYPGSKRYVGGKDAALISNHVSNGIKRTGVFVDDHIDLILAKIDAYSLEAIQLHGNESAETCQLLREEGMEVIKAFGVGAEFDFSALEEYDRVCDYFLFDTKTEQHGGSGMVFNWKILQNYELDKGYFLSGGLSLENLQSINSLADERLYAVDLNSKFEIEPGIKDVKRLALAFQQLKNSKL